MYALKWIPQYGGVMLATVSSKAFSFRANGPPDSKRRGRAAWQEPYVNFSRAFIFANFYYFSVNQSESKTLIDLEMIRKIVQRVKPPKNTAFVQPPPPLGGEGRL